MFICLDNLIRTELNHEGILLIPEPRYFKLLNLQLLNRKFPEDLLLQLHNQLPTA